MELYSRVFKASCVIREELTADAHEHFIRLHHIYLLDLVIVREFSCNASVTAADDQHLPDIRVDSHRYMDDHLIIRKLVLFRKDDRTVRCQEPAELLRIKYIYPLKITHAREQLLLDTYRHFHVSRMHFGKPEIHRNASSILRLVI